MATTRKHDIKTKNNNKGSNNNGDKIYRGHVGKHPLHCPSLRFRFAPEHSPTLILAVARHHQIPTSLSPRALRRRAEEHNCPTPLGRCTLSSVVATPRTPELENSAHWRLSAGPCVREADLISISHAPSLCPLTHHAQNNEVGAFHACRAAILYDTTTQTLKHMHQPGIGPGSHRWRRCILPLDH